MFGRWMGGGGGGGGEMSDKCRLLKRITQIASGENYLSKREAGRRFLAQSLQPGRLLYRRIGVWP